MTALSSAKRSPVVGILGGMGPSSTVDFYAKLVRATPAQRDQDHLRVTIWADPSTPDRTRALLGDGADPTPWLVRGVRTLITAGADVITIPCNTAHAFITAITDEAGRVPILNLIHHACRRTRQIDPHMRSVGLLATTGTLKAGLYHEPLRRAGMTVLTPDARSQATDVMPAIAGVKASHTNNGVLRRLTDELAERGAQAIIAGCTEVALALQGVRPAVPIIDPAQVLADATVAWVQAQDKEHRRDTSPESHVSPHISASA